MVAQSRFQMFLPSSTNYIREYHPSGLLRMIPYSDAGLVSMIDDSSTDDIIKWADDGESFYS